MKGKLNLLQKLGLVLVIASCAVLLGSEAVAARNRSAVQQITSQIKASLPECAQGDPGSYSDTAMPVLQIGGEDFGALLEVPLFGVVLPVGSSWEDGHISQYPCRFWGSAYDNTLIVGGSGRKGQLDFCGKLSLGDKLRITDMTGTQFSYEVVRIDRAKHADMDTLQKNICDLTLFARDSTSLDYIVVRCRCA